MKKRIDEPVRPDQIVRSTRIKLGGLVSAILHSCEKIHISTPYRVFHVPKRTYCLHKEPLFGMSNHVHQYNRVQAGLHTLAPTGRLKMKDEWSPEPSILPLVRTFCHGSFTELPPQGNQGEKPCESKPNNTTPVARLARQC